MDIPATVIDLLRQRAQGVSVCPSDVARALADDEPAWQALMPPIRDAAAALARSECIVVTQGNDPVDPADVDQGPMRLRRGPMFPAK
jgi:hypothetical protein